MCQGYPGESQVIGDCQSAVTSHSQAVALRSCGAAGNAQTLIQDVHLHHEKSARLPSGLTASPQLQPPVLSL